MNRVTKDENRTGADQVEILIWLTLRKVESGACAE